MSSFIQSPRCGCALSGAMATATAIPRGIPVLHSSSGCAGSVAWSQLGGGALQVGGYCGSLSVPSTNVQEREVVFGGNERLAEQLKNTFEVMDGDLYMVITGCVPAMIGDDVRATCSEFVAAGRPLVIANTAGFKGCAHLGYDLLLEAIATQFVRKGLKRKKNKVNLLGVVPNSDVFWRGNIAGLKTLLEPLGLEVNAFFSGADSVENIANSSEAALTIVASGAYGVRAAKAYETTHGIPWLSLPLPIGPSASTAFVHAVAAALKLPAGKADKVAQAGEAHYFHHVATLADAYSDMDLQRYAVVIGDANYAAAIPRFLAQDLGWLPELVVCTDELDPESKTRVEDSLLELEPGTRPYLVFESETARIPEHLEKRWPKGTPFSPAFVVGSSLDRGLATALGAAHLSVSYPVANRAVLDRGYTGYTGGLRLVEDLLSAIVAGR